LKCVRQASLPVVLRHRTGSVAVEGFPEAEDRE